SLQNNTAPVKKGGRQTALFVFGAPYPLEFSIRKPISFLSCSIDSEKQRQEMSLFFVGSSSRPLKLTLAMSI
ncbi:MAG: hypothetical protein KDD70_09775, partial [Bdellovibrionales bacterium]|nr:hypothetical protein [Bdellovibrionales bacterium]